MIYWYVDLPATSGWSGAEPPYRQMMTVSLRMHDGRSALPIKESIR
jgi:hypothetical protein